MMSSSSSWFRAEFGVHEEEIITNNNDENKKGLIAIEKDDNDWKFAGKTHILEALSGDKVGESFYVGPFSTPSIAELRSMLEELKHNRKNNDHDHHHDNNNGHHCGITFTNIIGDARSLILDPNNAGSVFQVASQFNCLEMISPGVAPEEGVTRYVMDKTQV